MSACVSAFVRVAAIQLQAHDRHDFPRRYDDILENVRIAATQADLVVLPEGTIPAYVLGAAPLDWKAMETALERLREIARSTSTIVVAGAAASVDGRVRNSAVVVDRDGSIAGRSDKLFLWHFDRQWFTPGERLAPVQTSLGSLGVLICADGRIPTIASTLVERGAVALVMPTAWVTSGRDPDALENVQADLLARVRAYENQVPFVAANKCGSELGMVAYCGKSQIIDARGEVLAIAAERRPETVTARLSFAGVSTPLISRTSTLPPHATASEEPVRIAISFEPLASDIDERVQILGARYAIAPEDEGRFSALSQDVAAATADDTTVLDPTGLVPLRRAGVALVVWKSAIDSAWVERVARARALELRIYVVAFDGRARRAFAVDPDGAVIAGTFGGFTLAGFVFDPRKTLETCVAPGTDVAEGLDRVGALR